MVIGDFQINRVVVLMALLLSGTALAEVTASVDRQRVELNESFTLTIDVDAGVGAEPDMEPLAGDFFVGPRREMSNTTIVNGQISRSRSFSYSMTAKRAGTLTIPPIQVGTEKTQALTLEVIEPTYQPPGEADVFITTEVDTTETYVQAQVLYRIKVYRAVSTRQPALREPTFNGAEVLIEPAGDPRDYDARLGDKVYAVNERVFALFPQESGEIQISPAQFEARVFRNGRITGRKTFTSESQTLTVKPIPEPPADYPNAAWFPARNVSLSQDWSDDRDEVKAGEPITRVVTVSALGQLETQVPVIEPPDVAGVNIYSDMPELSRLTEEDGIRGIRRDNYAIIGVRAGSVELPQLELPWFDLTDDTWKVATLPSATLGIVAADDAFMQTPEQTVAESAEPTVVTVHSDFWRRVAEIIGVVWLLTLAAWYLTSRPKPDEKPPAELPLHRQQAHALKEARKAATLADAPRVKRALLEWARIQWPQRPPRSIGELATRVEPPLSTALEALAASTYGPAGESWDGKSLDRALRSIRLKDEEKTAEHSEALPPLMP